MVCSAPAGQVLAVMVRFGRVRPAAGWGGAFGQSSCGWVCCARFRSAGEGLVLAVQVWPGPHRRGPSWYGKFWQSGLTVVWPAWMMQVLAVNQTIRR